LSPKDRFSAFLPSAHHGLKTKLQRLIAISLTSLRPFNAQTVQPIEFPVWSADFFNLTESPFWTKLNDATKQSFLMTQSELIISEILGIEHAGVAYANKMATYAKNTDERQFYTSVAQEELLHLKWIQTFVKPNTDLEPSSFSQMIGNLIENETRASLVILIQILLEGWGIDYYSRLIKGTQHSQIQNVLKEILSDESRHHAGGLFIYEETNAFICNDELLQSIQSILDTVRIGPYQIASALCSIHKINNIKDSIELLSSIKSTQTTEQNLFSLKSILKRVLTEEDLRKLNWTQLNLSEMADFLLRTRSNIEMNCPTINA
jgi:rubrerythrin